MPRLTSLLAGCLCLAIGACVEAPGTKTALLPDAKVPEVYNVFFNLDSDEIAAEAQKNIDEIAAEAREVKPSAILIVGFADRTGPPGYNRALWERRATAVEKALIAKGLPRELFRVAAMGADPAIDLAVRGRRVEVQFQK